MGDVGDIGFKGMSLATNVIRLKDGAPINLPDFVQVISVH